MAPMLTETWDWAVLSTTHTKLAFLDLDGVLCNDEHRVHHALARRWGMYFGEILGDKCWPQGKELYENLLIAGYDIAYLTGRREDTRRDTLASFKKLGYDTEFPLIMRKYGDRRPLGEFKAAVVWWTYELYDEVVLYDDDPSVIAAVAEKVSPTAAKHCGWYVKPARMIRKAKT